MFSKAKAFNQDLSQWVVSNTTDLTDIFSKSGLSQENYCKLEKLPAWTKANLGISYNCQTK
jgi:hypothetical protein